MLKNPLEIEDRINLLSKCLFGGHRFNYPGVLVDEVIEDKNSEEICKAKADYSDNVLFAMSSILGDKNRFDYSISPENIETMFDSIIILYKNYVSELTFMNNLNKKFKSDKGSLYLIVQNLISNATHKFMDDKNSKVEISFSNFSGNIDDLAHTLVYTSPETPTDGDFVKINVKDNGHPFSKEYELVRYTEYGVKGGFRGKTGCGLYIVKMMCKMLRSHLAIDSKFRDVNVVVYHPLNL